MTSLAFVACLAILYFITGAVPPSFGESCWCCEPGFDSCKMETGSSSAVRCTWESRAGKPGLTLADSAELSLPTGAVCKSLPNVPAEQIHESAEGYSFVSLARSQELITMRTIRPFILVLKGFVKHKLKEGVEDEQRVCQLILTVFDHVSNKEEPRALTLINLAADGCDYICKTHHDSALELSDEVKIPVFIEIRKSEAALADWNSFGSAEAFAVYSESLMKSTALSHRVVLHKVVEKDEYTMRRVLVPTDSRDTLYRKSGQCSVQIRAARLPTDPSETGLEVMRVYGERDLAAVTRAGESIPGWLGAFASNGAFYIRTDDKHIKEARKFWFEADERFDDDNIALKCAKQFRVQGFTAGTTCKDVRATLKAAGWNVVPLRVIHIQELATAIVASDKDPGSWKIASSLGTLLITSEDRKPRKIAATSKGTPLQALRDESKTKNPMPFMASAQPSTAVPLPARQGQSLLPAPYAGMASRIEQLEVEMKGVHQSIAGLEEGQKNTNVKLQSLQDSQNTGFSQLLDAIKDIKGEIASHSSPTKPQSPLHKAQRK